MMETTAAGSGLEANVQGASGRDALHEAPETVWVGGARILL